MRILFFESYPVWTKGFPDGFSDLGHEILISGPLTEETVKQLVLSFSPHLAVTVGWGPELTDQKQIWIEKYVHAAKTPLVYWAVEDPTFTDEWSWPLITRMKPDYVFTICEPMVKVYRERGIKASPLQFGYHSSIHHQTGVFDEYRASVALVANAYPHVLKDHPELYRHQSLEILVKPLLKAGLRVDIWGDDWEKMDDYLGHHVPNDWLHGYLPYTEANKVYCSADIVLGLQNAEDQLTQRTYEILGSGGFLLTSDIPVIRRLFKPGRDLIVSGCPGETIELINFYLRKPRKRKKIRRHALVAAIPHSYRERARYILTVLQAEGILP